MRKKLLVVDDDPLIRELVAEALAPEGYRVCCATNGEEALAFFSSTQIDLAIIDYSLPDLCGAELFHQLRLMYPELPVIFLTGHANLETAVALMKSGVRDYVIKPFDLQELCSRVNAALESSNDFSKKAVLSVRAPGNWAPGGYTYFDSESMRSLEAQIRNLPDYPDTTVLITGPTGTGKSVLARHIHELTWGQTAPFVEIDCSTIPRELCESELFGHEKGAFTGAHTAKPGLFEAAGHGTAFLDEIGELDSTLQTKFLHVLEARRFKRVGGHTSLLMSARVIAATNRSLPDLVRSGKFREDLYFRLNVFELWMPPLKDRRNDVHVLAQNFLNYFATRYKKNISSFTPEALGFLRSCDFPGNIRELRNMIERAVINSNTSAIEFTHLIASRARPPQIPLAATPPRDISAKKPEPLQGDQTGQSETLNLALIEQQKISEALTAAKGNKSKAARLVGLSRTAFHRRLQRYRIRTR
jgi:DNA-binding NtrC family response regulator